MAKENFLLLSLKESKTKKLAQVISNETSRKILDYLAEKEATETELAKKLNIPISTVHYNLHALQEGGLVDVEEFHYSSKGKEVNHYKLANKYIIIAPKTTYGIKEKLKTILPVALLTAATAGIIQFASKSRLFAAKLAEPIMEAKTEAVRATIEAGEKAAEKAQLMIPGITEAAIEPAVTTPEPNIALWFLFGAVFAILIYLIAELIIKKMEK